LPLSLPLLLPLVGLPKRLSMSICKSSSDLAGCMNDAAICCCCCRCCGGGCGCCCLDNPGGLVTTAPPLPPSEAGNGSSLHSGAVSSSSSDPTFFSSTTALRGGAVIPCSFKYFTLSASNRAASPSSGTKASSNPPLLIPFNLLAPSPPADGISQ
jgi:hypothetical protein